MGRAGTVLSLLALLAVQVPWISCTSDCQRAMVSALTGHACHVEGAHGAVCACAHAPEEHAECEAGGPEQPVREEAPGQHECAFAPVLGDATAVSLVAPLVACLIPQVQTLPEPGVQLHDALRQEPRAGPPLPATTRRLL